MPQNRIVVEGPVDYEDTLEGINFLYEVKGCDVDAKKGKLIWDRVVFPIFPIPPGSSTGDLGPMVSRSKPTITHVSSMSRVGDDMLGLLRDRGVDVVIINSTLSAAGCEG